MAEPYVFISYSRQDRSFVEKLTESLQSAGIQTWIDLENIPAGTNWQKEISGGLLNASVLIYVASRNSVSSQWIEHELDYFLERGGHVIPIVIDDEGAKHLPLSLQRFQWADFRYDYNHAFHALIGGIRYLEQPTPIAAPPKVKSKGYIFLSYAEEDADFVDALKGFLGEQGYAYWDFRESDRDYQINFYDELEGVINDASGMLSIVSPYWKQSDVAKQEFFYSKEVGIPVFLLRVTDPGPTLALAGLPYIDFTGGHQQGFVKLDRELQRRGL